MASLRTARTSSGMISGVGLANAKMIGLAAMLATAGALSTPPADSPRKTSAPTIASVKVRWAVSWANSLLSGSISSIRPW